MFQPVVDSIQSFGSFTKEELLIFEHKLSCLFVTKNDFILKEGHVCQSFYFILSGSCIHNYPAQDGSDHIVNLYVTGDWFTDYQSFTSQKPSTTSIQAFEDTRLATIDIHSLHHLVIESPVFFRAGRLFQTMQYTDISNLGLSPEEKYRELLLKRPELLQKFPLKFLASYLRIRPETLSRIRKRIR